MSTFQEFLKWERASRDTIDVKTVYIDMAGELRAGIMLSQIMYWIMPGKNGQSKLRVSKNGHKWLVKADAEWWDEIRITAKQAKTARKRLMDVGVIDVEYHLFGSRPGKRTCHYRIEEKTFLKLLKKYLDKPLEKPEKSVSTKMADRSGETNMGRPGKTTTGRPSVRPHRADPLQRLPETSEQRGTPALTITIEDEEKPNNEARELLKKIETLIDPVHLYPDLFMKDAGEVVPDLLQDYSADVILGSLKLCIAADPDKLRFFFSKNDFEKRWRKEYRPPEKPKEPCPCCGWRYFNGRTCYRCSYDLAEHDLEKHKTWWKEVCEARKAREAAA